MKVEFTAVAERELDETVSFFETRRTGLDLAIAAEAALAVSRIEQYPHAWQSLAGDTRRGLLRKSEYGLVYRVRNDTVTIDAVMHLRRRPTYWRKPLRAD